MTFSVAGMLSLQELARASAPGPFSGLSVSRFDRRAGRKRSGRNK